MQGAELPDVGHGVVDQLQRRQQEVLVEVLPGEDLGGRLTHVQEAEAVPVAAALGQICRSQTQRSGGQEVSDIRSSAWTAAVT